MGLGLLQKGSVIYWRGGGGRVKPLGPWRSNPQALDLRGLGRFAKKYDSRHRHRVCSCKGCRVS